MINMSDLNLFKGVSKKTVHPKFEMPFGQEGIILGSGLEDDLWTLEDVLKGLIPPLDRSGYP